MDPLRELKNSKKSFMRVNRQRNSSAQRKKRTVLSCTPCRQRKVKCDRLVPCSQCTQRSTAEACDFSNVRLESATTVSPVQSASPAQEPESDHQLDLSAVRRPTLVPPLLNMRPASLTAPCNHPLATGPDQALDSVNSLTQSCFHGAGTRTRFFGRSHWALTMDMFPDLKAHLQKYHHVKKGPSRPHPHDHQGVRHAKERRLQTTYQTHTQANSGLESLVPPRQVTDQLVDLYFSTFETTFRILHVPQFLTEYEEFWNSKDRAAPNVWSRDVFAAKLLSLLICAASLADPKALKTDDPSQPQLSAQTAKDWLQAVGSWVKTVTTYAKLDLDFIQVMCLLLIARQAIAYEGDLAWLAAGSLVREAMMVGLHRDPSNFKGISPFLAEIRRRLWYTIVQLDLQAALDTGVPASISEDDFDCAAPSNLEDEDLSTDLTELPASKEGTVLTRTSFLVLLAQTLSAQIKIVKIINQVRLTSTYQDILDLSQVITDDFRQSPFLASLKDTGESTSDFRISLYLFLIYRYLLALHRPFVLSLAETPTEMYAYSRRICIQACIALLAPVMSIEDSSTAQVVLPLILRLRGGMFRSELFHAAATLCFELRLQAKDNILPPLPGAPAYDLNQGQRKSLMRNVDAAIHYFSIKVRTEKQACKAFMLLNMVYVSAQSELLSGQKKGELSLESACPRTARRCQELLQEGGDGRAECQHSEENWLGYPGNPLMNEEVPELREGHRHSPPDTSAARDIQGSDTIADPGLDLFDLSFDWGMYLDPSYLDESGNLWPLMDPLI